MITNNNGNIHLISVLLDEFKFNKVGFDINKNNNINKYNNIEFLISLFILN